MKPEETTPKALLEFFSELESNGTDEECELHYGCGCVIAKGVKAAQMLVAVQKALGVESIAAASASPGATAGAKSGGTGGAAVDPDRMELTDFEAALLAPGFPKAAAAPTPDPETVERLSEAEGEIDRLLMQTVDLKKENKLLREKIRDLYKQIERLYTRSEMSKLLGTLDEKIAREAEAEAASAETGEPETGERETGAEEADAETEGEAEAEVAEAEAVMEDEGGPVESEESASTGISTDGEAEAVEDAASESSADSGKN